MKTVGYIIGKEEKKVVLIQPKPEPKPKAVRIPKNKK